jgi:aspartate kinase
MGLIVKKFGGTSVADVECMQRVARRIREARDAGDDVVVVVSAMGQTTDELIALARKVHPDPDDRELDVLMSTGEQISSSVLCMALHALGTDAVSFTGAQAGIFTDNAHTRAKILRIDPERLRGELRRGRVVIVAGFQGVTPELNVATLGRGGSDTTAVALAAALQADRCQIYTDVDGVYTADPRVVANAVRLQEIAYDEMLELASLGARVLQSRSVEFAKKFNVELEVLSSFSGLPGTVVRNEVKAMEEIVVRGVAADAAQAKVTLRAVEDRPGVAAQIFERLAAANIVVDMIVQNVSDEGFTDLSFTVPEDDLTRVRSTIDALLKDIRVKQVSYDANIAKVSIVGVGMKSHSGVAHRMFRALADANINIGMISTSEIKISVVIEKVEVDRAMQLLHDAFGLESVQG